jgi:pimeloyl-ACP methyl ester carboxylesterase
VGSVSVTVTNPGNGHSLATEIYYPAVDGQVDPSRGTYATLVFARGSFSSATFYPGNGTHLASWGYITALPNFPTQFPTEDIEGRASDVQYILSYMEAENANPVSIFYQRIDVNRLGVAGHSLGGLTTLMVAARDARVKAAVALDPVNPPIGGSWDYQKEAPDISAPTALIGAPPQMCNSFANYNDLYPVVGSDHKAKWVVTNGSHCDFVHTDNTTQRDACYVVCGGTYSVERVQLVEQYTTAWFNYYLQGQTEFYSYLYGPDAQADIDAGLVTREFQTAPRDVSASPRTNAVELRWRLPAYPVIAGYDIYRRTQGGAYPDSPSVLTGRASSYVDGDVTGGVPFYYVLRSWDAAGNEHQTSDEVSAVPIVGPTGTATATPSPTGTPSATPTTTLTPTATRVFPHWLPLLLVGGQL